jgi:hypothetical protein
MTTTLFVRCLTDLSISDYQKQFAEIWLAREDISLPTLINEHSNSSFGVRAIGYYGQSEKVQWKQKKIIAELLFNHEEYDLASHLYEELDEAKHLEFEDLLNYGSAISYKILTEKGAYMGLEIIDRARQLARDRLEKDPSNPKKQMDVSFATQNYASMLAWIWNLTRDDDDLIKVINELREAIQMIEDLLERGEHVPVGRYAQNLLRLAMFLRIAEKDRDRYDLEKNFQKVLALKTGPKERYVSTSYLRWYQIFVLADMGKYDDAQKRAMTAISEDIKFANREENSEIGRRQYTLLRGFLEEYSRYWRDTKSIGRVSQIINSAKFR